MITLEDKLYVQTAAERLNFIEEYLDNNEDIEKSIIKKFCSFPCRSEKQVFDQIQSICYMGSLDWVKMQINNQIRRGKTSILVLIYNTEFSEVEKMIEEKNMTITQVANSLYTDCSYYKITF